MNDTERSLFAIFAVLVAVSLVVDLGFVSRRGRKDGGSPTMRAALGWTAFWIALAGAFSGLIAWRLGPDPAVTFATGYVVELALSVDNLFVFLLVFRAFGIAKQDQRRALFWGVLGALVFRGICIAAGVAALERFHWLSWVFGAILVVSGVKTALSKDDEEKDIAESGLMRFVRRLVPKATPFILAMIAIEVSDVIFAVDSIPAVLAITRNPFLVYTSNVFAILGLRSLFFALAGLMDAFHLLKYSLALVLIFVGVKIAGAAWFEIPTGVTLAVVVLTLGTGIAASLIRRS